MRIQSINPSFTGRIRMDKLKSIVNETPALKRTITSSTPTGAAATATSSVALDAAISGSQLTGTAFMSQASGLNSSGIAPFVMEMAEPIVAPSAIAASQKYPSVVGTLSTTTGEIFSHLKNPTKNIKDPS